MPMLFALALIAMLVAGPAYADSGGGGWMAVSDALAGLAVAVIGVLALALASLRPVLVEAIRAWAGARVEEATTLRVSRLDDALVTSIAAGRAPDEAAAEAAAKLPLTLARSGKTIIDLTAEASVIRAARGGSEGGHHG